MPADSSKHLLEPVELAGEPDFALGALNVRPSLGEVEIAGQKERLEPRVMQVLVALARAAGRVVSRDELIACCWGGVIVGDDAINRVIGRVRRLSERVPRPFTLETVPRIGYRLIPASPAEAVEPPPARWGQLQALWRKPRARAALAATAVLAGILAVWLILSPSDPQTRRVAVLPLSAPQGDVELGTVVDGVAADVATALTPSGIEVLARPMTSGDLRTRLSWARAAGAAYAIEGAVQRVGDDINITTRIVSTDDPVTRWSQSLSEPKEKVRELRYASAARVASVVHCGFVRGATRLDSASRTILFEACGLPINPDRAQRVRDLMQQLRQREPRFGYAHAAFALASAQAALVDNVPAAQQALLRNESRDAAATALRLDPRLGDAYFAQHLLATGSPAAIEAPLLRGLARDELNSALNAAYGAFLLRVGRTREGLAYAKRAEALDPLSPARSGTTLAAMFAAGQMDEARQRAEALAIAWPDDGNFRLSRARALFWTGDYDASLPLAPGGDRRGCWRRSVGWMQRTDAAGRRDAAREGRACFDSGDLGPVQALMLLSSLDVDAAYAMAATWRAPLVQNSGEWRLRATEAFFLPPTAAMRADPRFMPLMRDIGLLDYWRSSNQWPDFCTDEKLPYDCKTEAARLVGGNR